MLKYHVQTSYCKQNKNKAKLLQRIKLKFFKFKRSLLLNGTIKEQNCHKLHILKKIDKKPKSPK